jgi:hypothetical protein
LPHQGVAKPQISESACHAVAGSVGRSMETLRPDLARQYKGGYMFSKDLLEHKIGGLWVWVLEEKSQRLVCKKFLMEWIKIEHTKKI